MTSTPKVPPDTSPPLDLAGLYPNCFDRANPRPLKRKIHRDLIKIAYRGPAVQTVPSGPARREARLEVRRQIRQALRVYCVQPAYLGALREGTDRLDLDGQPSGAVTTHEAERARALLAGESPPPPPLDSATDTMSAPAPALDLAAHYPACFDWRQPRPLKLGIAQDLLAAGHDRKAIRRALGAYCSRVRYLKALRAGTPRIDLQGQPIGAVTEDESAQALARLAGEGIPPSRPAANASRAGQPAPDLPSDAPLTEDNIVTGHLELTVKFSALPKPVAVKSGMKIGIQTDSALVVATLPPKAWKKLEKANTDWPSWVAALTGKLGAQAGTTGGAVVVLDQPAVQVFERKARSAD